MLLELKIQNLAIIESIEANFAQGLNVITGETGAGKSILLAALNLVLGGRSDRELIRTGKEEAAVEAVFENIPTIAPLFEEWGINYDASEPIALRRVVHINGRSRAYVNCSSIPTNQLRKMAPLLLDFGRQHEQSALMNADQHIEFLDRYADTCQQSEAVQQKYSEVTTLLREFTTLTEEKSTRAERTKFLEFQRRNIEDVNPQPNEEEELTTELQKLSDAEKCKELAKNAEYELYNKGDSIQEKLAHVISEMVDLMELDESVKHVVEDLENALITVEEAASTLRAYQKQVHRDSERIAEVQDRLDQVIDIQSRYGGSYEEVLIKLKEIEKELKQLDKQEKRLQKLSDIIAKEKSKLRDQAIDLSQKRYKAATNLAPLIQSELVDLAMENARFEVSLTPITEDNTNALICPNLKDPEQKSYVASWGIESVNFLFSANPGEELRQLQRVASGGEMSRIMLGIKHIIGGAFAVPTVIFDEIDSGISGTAATMVAQKLRQIVADKEPPNQIICISHTAQVAAEADEHFLVQKQTINERTNSQINLMDRPERIREVSRMLAGDQSREQATALAEELVRK